VKEVSENEAVRKKVSIKDTKEAPAGRIGGTTKKKNSHRRKQPEESEIKETISDACYRLSAQPIKLLTSS
jgi:hypothetical protein